MSGERDREGFEAHAITIKELFCGQENLSEQGSEEGPHYTIPAYQRGYTWRRDQIKQLLDDLREAVEMGGYFLSTITVCRKRNGHIEVIDGQQRLVTLSLIMQVLDEHIRDVCKDRDAPGRPQLLSAKNLLQECLIIGEEKHRVSVDLRSPADAKPFKDIMDGKGMCLKLDKTHIGDAYKEINEWVKPMKAQRPEDMGEIAEFLLEKTIMTRSIVPDNYAYQIFESLNDRGVILDPWDLIKSRLFFLTRDDPSTQAFIDEKLKEIGEKIKILPNGEKKLLENMRDYSRIYLQVRKVPLTAHNIVVDQENVYRDYFRKQIKEAKGARDFIEKLSEEEMLRAFLATRGYEIPTELWSKGDIKTSRFKHYLKVLKELDVCKPVLFSCFYHYSRGDIAENVLRQTFHDLFCLVGRTRDALGNEIPTTLGDVLGKFSAVMFEKPKVELTSLLRSLLDEKHGEKLVSIDGQLADVEWEMNKRFEYQKSRCAKEMEIRKTKIKRGSAKRILLGISLFADEDEPMNSDNWNMGHILTQNRGKLSDWPGFNEEAHEEYRERLGNCVILKGGDEKKGRDGGIDEKLGIYESPKYSHMKILTNVREYLKAKEWTPAAIEAREKDLINAYVDAVKFTWE